MDLNLKKKYIKYKQKYLKMQTKLIGGSYTINSSGIEKTQTLYEYPEFSILSDKSIGSGGSGSVKLGIIIKCSINPDLINKKVAIKAFFKDTHFSSEQRQQYEKQKMLTFGLDEVDRLVIDPQIATLYFDIKNGPLKDNLIYEYGGKTFDKYYNDSTVCNLENNKRIMIQLFKILFELAQRDNMHNDIKTVNITYDINDTNEVNIKLIDFGSSMSISKLNDGSENFRRRINMKTPETIYNFLNSNGLTDKFFEVNGTIGGKNYNIFNKWYYYPFISIVCYLFTGIEYSTGNPARINELIGKIYPFDDIVLKKKLLGVLLDNKNIIQFITENIKPEFHSYLDHLIELINLVCIGSPSERNNEHNIIEFLEKL